MSITSVLTRNYKDLGLSEQSQNKPNSNPIKANQTQFKAKTNPKRTQLPKG